jgi:hypothetical protein
MTASPNLKLTIEFNDAALNPEERDEQALLLIDELRNIDEVETVDRVLDPNLPEGAKPAFGFIWGLLMAEVSKDNAKKLFDFLRDRLGGKSI